MPSCSPRLRYLAAAVAALLGAGVAGAAPPARGLVAVIRARAGVYSITAPALGWTFSGQVGAALGRVSWSQGRDALGAFRTATMDWVWHGLPVEGRITTWRRWPVARFALVFLAATPHPRLAFPDFDRLPPHLYVFSYRDRVFSPPQFRAGRSASPWLLFQAVPGPRGLRYPAAIFSPASHFQTSVLRGDGIHRAAARLDPDIGAAPAGTTVTALLALAPGINRAFRLWGRALTTLAGARRRPPGPLLQSLGYWTDNGAHYYYHYRRALGYAGTLLAELGDLRQRRIPVRYLQLDSWWYQKDAMSYDGRLLPAKSSAYQAARWNVYGGIWLYRAAPALFPQGLAAFQRAAGVPLAVHARWISQRSPYHQRFHIVGVAPVDSGYWRQVAVYLHASGAVTYEQDWLSVIRRYSGFARHLGRGQAFFGGMARAMRVHGLSIQYCMPLPGEILEASRWGDVTTSRVSNDHFARDRWWNFLFTSRLVSALGVRPWADVTSSSGADNILLQTLSAGPVGFGDAIGQADRQVLLQAVRADGQIIKPDTTLVPIAADYLHAARGVARPVIGRAFTGRGAMKTAYVFAFARDLGDATGPVRFSAPEIGLEGGMYVYNYFARRGRWVPAGQVFQGPLGPRQAAYYICAAPGPAGIAFLGDARDFVGNGAARIPWLRQTAQGVAATVVFAPGERWVILHGYARFAPKIHVRGGRAGPLTWSLASGLFSFALRPPAGRSAGLRTVRVRLTR